MIGRPAGEGSTAPLEGGWRILLVAGSGSRPSHTRSLVDAAQAVLTVAGCDTRLWDLSESPLPLVGCGRRTADAEAFRAAVAHVDALVLGTPLYHNSYSGVVKNALDHLEEHQVRGKPVGLLSTSGGPPSPQAVDHLRVVVRALRGVAIPCQVIAADREFAYRDDRYELVDAGVRKRVEEFARELLWFAGRLRDGGASRHGASGNGASQNGAGPSVAVERGEVGPDLPDYMGRALSYLREHFATNGLSLGTVAREACMSRYHFSRTFKSQTGMRFIDFVTMLRLNAARSLLLTTDDSVTSICYRVGYGDLSHFERTFKRRFGMCPSEYRGRHRRNGGSMPAGPTGVNRAPAAATGSSGATSSPGPSGDPQLTLWQRELLRMFELPEP